MIEVEKGMKMKESSTNTENKTKEKLGRGGRANNLVENV